MGDEYENFTMQEAFNKVSARLTKLIDDMNEFIVEYYKSLETRKETERIFGDFMTTVNEFMEKSNEQSLKDIKMFEAQSAANDRLISQNNANNVYIAGIIEDLKAKIIKGDK